MAPLLVVVGANVGLVSLRGWVIARALLFAAAATAVVLFALRRSYNVDLTTLNRGYLDEIARQTGPLATTREPLGYLVAENALMRMASRAGYRVVGIGSDYPATRRFPRADVCVCSQFVLARMIEAIDVLLARTYLGVDLAPLPDRSLFSPLERPYDFVQVP
jgi:hypothetical protein